MRDGDTTPPGARPTGGRYRLSVLFCDLCDSTALSHSLEAEEYAELLAALRQASDAAITRHGGTVVRIQGDGLLAVFGYPQPREGDGRRAVEAALQLHDAVKRIAVPARAGLREGLRLHSGIHAGMVLVQEGGLAIGRLELFGVVPNVAAHLSSQANRDELLVSDETLGPALAQFSAGAMRRLQVQGHEQPIDCWPVVGHVGRAGRTAGVEGSAGTGAAAPAVPRPAPARQRFVGRHRELEQLERRLGESLAGATRQVAIVGPPGVGKTRLASEFLQRTAQNGCRVLTGWCESELDAVPLQPVLQMVRAALGLTPEAPVAAALKVIGAALEMQGLADVVPTLLPLLGGAPPGAGERGEGGERGEPRAPRGAGAGAAAPTAPADPAPAIARLFATWAARKPLLLFIDDWHWSDAASRQALAAISAAASGAGLMIVLSTRSVDASDATMRQIEVLALAPLSPEEGAASIRALLPQVDPFVADDIYRYSGGNPLFIEELCHSAAHEQVRAAGQQVGAAWLQVLIESRVARLAPAQAELVRTLAVIGNVVPAALLAAITGLAPDDEALAELAEKDFVFPGPDGALRFKHGLTRDVIYESVGLRERRELHLRVAEALQRQGVPGGEAPHEALAYHFGAASRDAEAAHHAELAGDRAAALSALDRAKSLYHAALVRLQAAGLDRGRVQRWLAIANKLGLICVFDASRRDLPVFEQAVRLAQAQAEAAPRPPAHAPPSVTPEGLVQARAEYWLGYLLYALGQAREAVAHFGRAVVLAGPGTDALAVQIRAALGQAKAAASDYAGAEPLLADAVAIKRSHRRGARASVGLAYSLVCLASVAGDRGEFERAHELFDEAQGLVNGATHQIAASITGWRAVVFGWQGRWSEALEAAQESTHIAERTHSLFQFCQGRATGAYAEWMLKGEPSSIERLTESTLWLEPRESGLFRSLDHGWLTECWLALGDATQARRHAARALLRGRSGDLIGVALGCRAMARDAAARHDPVQAGRWLLRARRIAAQRESRHEAAGNELCAGEMALAAGALDLARRCADAAAAAFEQLQMRWHGERAQALLAQL
ncbi:MAG: AAA family ATPase [Burkholderiales bacterium]|nr:AAA family ATPase [Burkholderiales bacterium]